MQSSSFGNYITNKNYISAYGQIETKKKSDRFLFVENESDSYFWLRIFNKIFGERYIIKPSVNGSHVRGKVNLSKYYSTANESAVIAVDSDFDYIAQNSNDNAQVINNNKFIVQTFLYARESLFMNIDTLNLNIKKIYFSNHINYCFKHFLESLSSAIHSLFTTYIYLIDRRLIHSTQDLIQKINDLGLLENDEPFSLSEYQSVQLNEEEKNLIAKYQINQDHLIAFRKELSDKGLTTNNVFRFLDSHFVWGKIVGKIVCREQRYLFDHEVQRIKAECADSKHLIQEKIAELSNHLSRKCCFDTLINTCTSVENDYFYQSILRDVQKINEH